MLDSYHQSGLLCASTSGHRFMRRGQNEMTGGAPAVEGRMRRLGAVVARQLRHSLGWPFP
jgi:hypothetical protein